MNSAHRLRLLVEGKDDYHVTGHLLNENNVLRFDVKDCEGFNKVMDVFRAELKGSAAERIGIVVDADGEVDNGGPESRWESLRHLLGECGFEELPAEMPQTGLVTRGGDKPVGVWLMPDNRSRGMLEHFVETLVPERDQLWDRALKAVF